ncbi:sensor histidine kinase [Saccharothrix australiensis]|uniref:histidine kinase n=1 Tax=Saccharothrix australiensis TaxID=2072 RepID=A0A495VVY8_9PSEU|nr:sensor histidine kinase [Saccharothrix australiensis]RKT53542.1 histidine kinase [Saccharothrix australiensis]
MVIVLEVLAVAVPAAMVLLADVAPYAWSIPTALAACALLPVRRWWPCAAVLACLPALAGGLGWPPTVVALYRVGRTSSVRVMVVSAAVTTAFPATVVVATQHLTVGGVLLTYAFSLFMSGAPTALGALITTRQKLTESLAEASRAREAELEAREAGARASERARIAREIHDAVGHHATLIAVESAALAATTDSPEVRRTARRLRGLAKDALAEMRAALGLLNTEPAQGHEDIPHLVDRARAAGLTIRLDDKVDHLPPSISRAAFRVVQEALTNVTKHAPGAAVQVRLSKADGRVKVSVVNGRPLHPSTAEPGGSGLHGLSERIRLVGGTLTTTPRADGSWELEADLPSGPSKVDAGDSTSGGSAHNAANA